MIREKILKAGRYWWMCLEHCGIVLQDWTTPPDLGRRAGGATVVCGGRQVRSAGAEAPPDPTTISVVVFRFFNTHIACIYLPQSPLLV